jgi:hypothetical protein
VAAYVRPSLNVPVFHDPSGAVIDYGNRWPGEALPEDRYSVISHSERFAPLHSVADALIEHLWTTYEASVSHNIAVATDLMAGRNDVIRAVRIIPSREDASPLTFAFTSFPGVVVHAGFLHDFPFPDCGCDACDESLEGLAGEMEWKVMAVAAGGFTEFLGNRVGYRITSPDGTRFNGGTTLATDYPADRLRATEVRLHELPNGWHPWVPR